MDEFHDPQKSSDPRGAADREEVRRGENRYAAAREWLRAAERELLAAVQRLEAAIDRHPDVVEAYEQKAAAQAMRDLAEQQLAKLAIEYGFDR